MRTHSNYFLPSLCLGLTLAIACDDSGNDLERLEPDIELSDTSIKFGEVTIGGTKRVSFSIRNSGTDILRITSIEFSERFSASRTGLDIEPGAFVKLDAVFRPVNDDPETGQLIIRSNAKSEQVTKVNLSGVGVAGFLTVAPQKLDFGTVPLGAKRGLEFVVANSAIETFSGRVIAEEFSQTEHFSLTGIPAFGAPSQYSVNARSQVLYTLDYSPQELGTHNGRITFETCGSRCGLEIDISAASAQPVVVFSPSQLDFGVVGIGESKSEQLTIINNGSERLELIGVEVIGLDFSVADAPQFPIFVEPKNQYVLNVKFSPLRVQDYNAELFINTSDPILSRGRVAVVGKGEGALFQVDPPAIDFGVDASMRMSSRTFLVSNEGSTPVTVTSINLEGASEFALLGVPGFPVVLEGGETLVAQVQYQPVAESVSTATLTVTSDDLTSPVIRVPVFARYSVSACQVEINPPRLNFGALPLGFGRRQSVSVSNVGTRSCSLLSGSFGAGADPFFQAVGELFPRRLDPGESTELEFRFLPTESRDAKSNYTLVTDDAEFAKRQFGLAGRGGTESEIFILPQTLNFGKQRPGCAGIRRSVTIYNAGTSDELVQSIARTPTNPEFLAIGGTGASVEAGSSVIVDVVYRAQDLGVDYNDLIISLAGKPYDFIVPMVGEGSPNPRVTEVFQQLEKREVDVLFVIDDSCSMIEEQTSLVANFDSFISTANIRNVDFHIGVTTTDPFAVSGRLVGPVVTRATPQYSRAFSLQASRGVMGSGLETPLEAMFRAIEQAKSGQAFNRDLLRDDVTFVSVFVTDEDDQSPASELFYLSYLRRQFGENFLALGIAGEEMGCLTASPSLKLNNFLDLSGGNSASICSEDWSTALDTLGNAAFGLRKTFRLNQTADTNEPIEVYVDGNLMSANSWRYDRTRNEVVFDTNHIPAEGVQIEIVYVPRC
ncbi:MAG: choice-of-anchor D domain-containing protein [Myxococcota bacterium]|nr:choice-of-anchor D domain-containing protein [Myxococcota bacterium]